MSHGQHSQSQWIKCISTQGNLRGVALQATSLVQELVEMHKLEGDVARSLGEAVIAALMVASYCKGGERINLNIRGSAFIQQALVDANPDGTVRGYVIERHFEPGQMDTTRNFGPWGDGLLSVLRTKAGENEKPYIGTVPLITGHLAKDLTFYWLQSEQIPSAVGIAVKIEKGKVVSAGGFLVQAMPGATASELQDIENNIVGLQSLASELAKNENPVHLLSQIFSSTAFVLLEEKPLRFQCTCSQARVERALSLIGVVELSDMIEKDNGASVKCEFCGTDYKMSADRLRELIRAATSKKED